MSSTDLLSDDLLLLERLDVLIESTLDLIKAFATREQRPIHQIRRYVAERHCSYLFASADLQDKRNLVQNILTSTSQTLEALQSTASIHSFFLAVDPNDSGDEGFLGGTATGREFWRGLRGGGAAGANALKAHCLRTASSAMSMATEASIPTPRKLPASSLKAEVYSSVRNALRAASGIRNAEMRWKNPDQLDVYGVRLVGWPQGVPNTNPSILSISQNKLVHEALAKGDLRFESISSDEGTIFASTIQKTIDEMDVYFSYEGSSSDPAPQVPSHYNSSNNAESAQGKPVPVTGPSPFSVSSEPTPPSIPRDEVHNNKRRREDVD